MKVIDSRRVRGRSLGTVGPAAIADVALGAHDASAIEAAWRRVLGAMLTEVGLGALASEARVRPFPGGLSLIVPCPLELTLVVLDLHDHVLEDVGRVLEGRRPARRIARTMKRRVKDAARPRLGPLIAEATARGLPWVSDDDALTLGAGAAARTVSMDALPRIDEIDWDVLGAIPIALITGTNGKTTTTRLCARIAKEAGRVAGNSSTDGVTIDGRIEAEGDWTGAEAARRVLRDPRAQIALLETARGGVLRRGLAIDGVDAALVTNVADDHLGEYGVFDVETLARVKALVLDAVRPGGAWVVPEHDATLWSVITPPPSARLVMFTDVPGPRASAHVAAGGMLVARQDDRIVVRDGTSAPVELAPLAAIPITFDGHAGHNVKNALAASALMIAMGFSTDAIARGLRRFGSVASDNPGRGELTTLPTGARVLTDFGHNAAGMIELLALGRSIAPRPRRIVLVTSIAGDRSEGAFDAYAEAIARGGVDRVVVWESEGLLRGRRTGEIAGLLCRALGQRGVEVEAQHGEREALRAGIGRSAPDDLVIAAPHLLRLDAEALAALLR